MEPAIHRGDLLLLSNRYSTPLVSGDIVVYKLPGRDVPIVHRIIKVHEEHDTAAVDILTKGDNNLPDDRELYGDRKWLSRDMVVGRAFAFLPRAGMVCDRHGGRMHFWVLVAVRGRAAQPLLMLGRSRAWRRDRLCVIFLCPTFGNHSRGSSRDVRHVSDCSLPTEPLSFTCAAFAGPSDAQLTILMNDYPKLKFALLGGLSLLALIAGD